MVMMVRMAAVSHTPLDAPDAASTTYNHAPISEAAPFQVPRRTNSMGRFTAMSRITPPPTAAATPMKTAAGPARPLRSDFSTPTTVNRAKRQGVEDDPEQANSAHGLGHDDACHACNQHRRKVGGIGQGNRPQAQQDVADHAAPEAHDDGEEQQADHVEVFFDGKGRPRQCADGQGHQVDPKRDLEGNDRDCGFQHTLIVQVGRPSGNLSDDRCPECPQFR